MADWVVPLSDVRFDEAEVQAVADTYRSGWLSQGPRVAQFESAFASYVGSEQGIAVASGTAALQLICAAIDLGPGDEVLLPSLTFAATAAVVAQAGATPVFVDIASTSRPWLSATAARAAISARTRAIITVDYGGHPGEAGELRELADDRELFLIEDAAHAAGGRDSHRACGTFGHAGAFSFFANKNLPLGEGGMVVTDDLSLAARARLLRSHGLSADTWARHRGDEVDYDVLEPGFNFRLDEPRAALGLRLLRRLPRDLERRAELAREYQMALRDVEGVSPVFEQAEDELHNAWHIFPLLLDRDVDRSQFRAVLREARIQTSVHYPALHRTRAYAASSRAELPVTDDYSRRTVTLPLFPHMTGDQQTLVVDQIASAVGSRYS